MLFLALLIFAEFFNAPDGTYRDDFISFNPALKWWGLDLHWRGLCYFGISLGK